MQTVVSMSSSLSVNASGDENENENEENENDNKYNNDNGYASSDVGGARPSQTKKSKIQKKNIHCIATLTLLLIPDIKSKR